MQFNMKQPIATHAPFKKLLLLITAGAVLFNMMFWHEKLAINTLLFGIFAIAAIILLYPQALKNYRAKWLLLATLCSLVMVVIYNSAISCVAAIIATVLLMAYSKYRHRSLVYAGGSVLQTYWHFLPQIITYLKQFFSERKKTIVVFRRFRFALLPLLLVFVFFIIYLLANKVLADIVIQFTDKLEQWVQPVLNWVEPQRLLFLLLGFFITGGLLHRCFAGFFEKAEVLQTNDLTRTPKGFRRNYMGTWQSITRLFIGHHAGSNIALKYEYKAGMLSLAVLNVLLLFVNATDMVYVWYGARYKAGFAWAVYVHEGAEILVFSILLAMLVVLFFFRGNLNFFSGKKRLQQMAYIWLAQNTLLTGSVCVRNYYYVTHMGIAYKRIGVFVFTLLVFAGLLSVFLKIRYVKTSYYLIKLNAAVAFSVLILSTCVQWDVVIARYNLQHKDSIPVDVAFLLTLSDHALPELEPYKDFLNSPQTTLQRQYYLDYETGKPAAQLEVRILNFLYPAKQYTWLSWNLADATARKALLQKNPLQVKR